MLRVGMTGRFTLCATAALVVAVAIARADSVCLNRPVTVQASAGQTVTITARKNGADLVLRLFDPNSQAVAAADTPGEPDGRATVIHLVATGGAYSLRLLRPDRAPNPTTAEPGCYTIESITVAATVEADAQHAAGRAKLFEAATRDREGNREGRDAAIRLYLEAFQLIPEEGGFALYRAGTLASEAGDAAKGIEYLQKALASGSPQAPSSAARTWHALGVAYTRHGDRSKALEAFQKQLDLLRTLNDRPGQAVAWNNIAYTQSALGEQQKTLEAFRAAWEIRRALPDRKAEAAALSNVALAYSLMADQQKALDTYQEVLALRRAIGDKSGESYTLSILGNQYRDLGAEQTALEYYEQSIAVGRAAGDRKTESDTELGIGDVYFFLGEIKKSVDAYERAAALKREAKDPMGEALALIGIANVFSDLANRQKPSESMGLAGKKKALEYYEQALGLGRKSGDYAVQVFALIGAGIAYSATGDKNKAADYLNQGLFIFGIVRYKPGEGWVKYELARVERDRGNLDKALTLVSNARDIIESVRASVISPELRTSFFAAVHDCFGLEVDILMSMQRSAEALTASERARARVLLETLGEAQARIREGVDPGLLARERTLQSQLNAKEAARMQLLGAKQTPEAAAKLQKEIKDLAASYEEVNTQIRKSSPRYAALKFPQPLNLAEIQKQVLDEDTLLLEYSLGEARSFLWVVSKDEIASVVLAKRADVEEAAGKFHELLLNPAAPADLVAKSGQALSKMVFGDTRVAAGKRLLVVPDGTLQYIPFAALPDPGAGFAQPLIAGHEMVTVPSASTVAVLRRELESRQAAPKLLAVLADPVFSADDSRIGRAAGAPAPKEVIPADLSRPLDRALSDLGMRLQRLPGTRREAAGIAALVPEGQRKQALDFEASRATITSPEMGQYRIVHLATHGLLNTAHAELSGVVLSLVDAKGKPQDGFLRLHEIYNLKLAADLVVLSACQTGLGKEFRGEGLVGLTRGFMYAGAPRVLASLWKVDDRATSELMKRFYKAMLGPEALRPAAALRAAQTSIAATKGWENPYFWAAFTLQGEWR